jgi:hypothetical protein
MTFNILFYYGTVRYSILAVKKGSEKVVSLPLLPCLNNYKPP